MQVLRRTFAAMGDVHLSVGDDMAQQLEHAGCGPDISHWHCGVDTAVFNSSRRDVSTAKNSLRARLSGGSPTLPIVIYCGRIAPEKRLELSAPVMCKLAESIRAAAAGGGTRRGVSSVSASAPAVAFVVVGQGPSLAPLKALMAECGPTYSLTEAPGAVPTLLTAWPTGGIGVNPPGPPACITTFLGQVPHSPFLGSLYASADAFFSPSTCETLGQVFQEAMAAGTVPVGANIGGVPEVFDHGQEGFLFEPDDVDGAAAGLMSALADRAALLGRAAPALLPEALLRGGDKNRADRARDRVVSKSWGAAYAQAEAAYFRALATRWPYRVNRFRAK